MSTLFVAGASVRAAAFSTLRAGWAPIAADRFADTDLTACCQSHRIDPYPDGLLEIAQRIRASAWMYTGALENRPELVDRVARILPLWGNAGSVLQQVRNPATVCRALADAGLAVPPIRISADDVPRDGTWLIKPIRSAGGSGIEPYGRNAMDPTRSYLQLRIEGRPCSAVYVAAAGRSVLVGVTEQLVGVPWTGAGPFTYAGSLGPFELDVSQTDQFRLIGETLSGVFGLRGLFGVDAVVNESGVWPVEVNPRYTASCEILEWAFGIDAVALHVAACSENTLPDDVTRLSRGMSGKAIVYATADVLAGDKFAEHAHRSQTGPDWPGLADVPAPGTSVCCGHPVTTVLAQAADRDAVIDALRVRAARVRDILEPNPRFFIN